MLAGGVPESKVISIERKKIGVERLFSTVERRRSGDTRKTKGPALEEPRCKDVVLAFMLFSRQREGRIRSAERAEAHLNSVGN